MKITSLGSGFFRVEPDIPSARRVARGKLVDWRFGLKCVGFCRNNTPLSDGTPCTEVDGIAWVEQQPTEPGHVIDVDVIDELLFRTDKPRLKLFGPVPPMKRWEQNTCPSQAWVAAEDVVEASLRRELESREHLSIEKRVALPLLSQGRLGPGRIWFEYDHLYYHPTEPMDPNVAQALGYWVLSDQMVVPLSGKPGIVLPFESLAEAQQHGLEVTRVDWCDGRQMSVIEARVIDREKAMAVLPLLASFPSALSVQFGGYSGTPEAEVNEADLKGVTVQNCLILRRMSGGWCVPADSRLEGLTGVIYGEGLALSSAALTAAELIPVAVAARSWVLDKKTKRFQVREDGRELMGMYVKRTDMATCLPRRNWRVALNDRRKVWVKRFGDRLPKDWHLKSDEELERALLYRQRVAEGWAIEPEYGLDDRDLIGAVREWMQTQDGLTIHDPFTGEVAYLHSSLDSLLDSPLAVSLLKVLAGPAYGFICRALQRESVQMAVFADALAA